MSEHYEDIISQLRKMADDMDWSDKTCYCAGCELGEDIMERLRGLADWIVTQKKTEDV